jgi:hypothetical protein
MSRKATKGLIIALILEIHCNETATGLPPVTSAVFLIERKKENTFIWTLIKEIIKIQDLILFFSHTKLNLELYDKQT